MQNNKALAAPSINLEQELFNIENFKRDSDPLIEKAYELIDAENYQRAFELLTFAAVIDSQNTEILNGLGITLCEMGRLGEAVRILKMALRINEDSVTLANIAGAYWETEEYEKAAYCYQRAIELDPAFAEAHYNIINLYMDMNALYTAFIRCKEFCDKFPGDEEGRALMADIMLDLALSVY
jgi:tetratricopeptide (TPR) repeat protein